MIAERINVEHVRRDWMKSRAFDYRATFEGSDVRPIGYGPTRYAAIVDLLLSVEDDAPLMDWVA